MTPDNSAVGSVLADVAGSPGDVVKSQTDFSLFDTDFGWVGTLMNLNPGPAYLINLKQSNELVLSGTVVDPQTTPISLTPGWNWIGYLPQKSTDVNAALVSLNATAQANDLIKSQFAFAQYVDGIGWIGSLAAMDPGLGYQINRANAGTITYAVVNAPGIPGTLAGIAGSGIPSDRRTGKADLALRKSGGLKERRSFSSKGEAEAMHGGSARDLEASEHKKSGPVGYRGSGWQSDATAYPASMTYVAEITHDGSVWRNPNVAVGFFSGDELRGTGHIEYVLAGATTFAAGETVGTPGVPLMLTSEAALPVELSSFEARRDGSQIVLAWTTASETNNAGFSVEMQAAGEAWAARGFVDGNATSAAEHAYSYHVAVPMPGLYRFRLRQLDFDGTAAYSETVSISVDSPSAIMLAPPYPNPATDRATVSFAFASRQHVTLSLYDMLGRRVSTLFSGDFPAHTTRRLDIESAGLPGGVYLLRLSVAGYASTRTVTFVR